ncbi:MAG: hypothetical protein HYY46_26540 [Deltaproteobacteria bacterium]|nr:hypothetical protein [Deltaproteobacteria bacterium]
MARLVYAWLVIISLAVTALVGDRVIGWLSKWDGNRYEIVVSSGELPIPYVLDTRRGCVWRATILKPEFLASMVFMPMEGLDDLHGSARLIGLATRCLGGSAKEAAEYIDALKKSPGPFRKVIDDQERFRKLSPEAQRLVIEELAQRDETYQRLSRGTKLLVQGKIIEGRLE